jgi:LysM repeat protein
MADPEKAFLEFETGTKIPCMFNPESLAFTRANEWLPGTAAPGKGVGTAAYTGATPGSMSLNLLFDTTDDGTSVTNYTGALLKKMEIDPNLPGAKEESANGRPETVIFHWGKQLHTPPMAIQSMTVNFTYFSSKGVPLRAKVDITLLQFKDADVFGPQNPTSGTPRPHRVHRVQPGETLDRISARYYGDPTRWRALASANNVEDPLTVRPGSLLSLPELDSS